MLTDRPGVPRIPFGRLKPPNGLLRPEYQLVVLLSYQANLAHGSSHSVRDVELTEKDTEGGEKDEVRRFN